jgi:hypothetical protein
MMYQRQSSGSQSGCRTSRKAASTAINWYAYLPHSSPDIVADVEQKQSEEVLSFLTQVHKNNGWYLMIFFSSLRPSGWVDVALQLVVHLSASECLPKLFRMFK